jgi:hypothetical protein
VTPNATCAANSIDNGAIGAFDLTPGNSGTPVSTGSYSQTYTFSPPRAKTYHLCAYLSQSMYSSTEAVGQATFTPRPPHASGTVATTPTTPTADRVGDTAVAVARFRQASRWTAARSSAASSGPRRSPAPSVGSPR